MKRDRLGRHIRPGHWLGAQASPFFSCEPALIPALNEEEYFLLLFRGKNSFGREDGLHVVFHHFPAKVRDSLHPFQNFIVVGFVGAEGFPEFDLAHFYLRPGFYISLLRRQHDLAKALDLRTLQSQVSSSSVTIKQSQQSLGPEVVEGPAYSVPRHPLAAGDVHQAEE